MEKKVCSPLSWTYDGAKNFWDSKLYHEQCIGEQNFPPQNISLTRGLF